MSSARGSASPFQSLGCSSLAPFDASSVFETWTQPCYSCNLPIRGDGGSVCVDASGTIDYTSILVDMQSLQERTGCFGWSAEQCALDLRRVSSIEFNFDL